MAEVAVDLPPGTMLGNLVVKGVLGRGGMGVVYLAEDPLIAREVAVKLLPRELSQDAKQLARFLEEARAAGRIEHPNIVPIYQAGEHAGLHYIVMPVVRGGSVADLLRNGQPLPWQRATRLMADACRGLAVAHATGVVHRDIKPANLLLAADGGARVADFGLAKALFARGESLTQTGAILGTPAFMSPEQCQAQALDHRSDIYSLGATYFAMLTGRSPFQADSAMQLMFAHCSAAVPDPRTLRPDVPAACAQIAARAMAKAPGDRYQSAGEMLAALEAALGDGVVRSSTVRSALENAETLAAPPVTAPAAPTLTAPAAPTVPAPAAPRASRVWPALGAAALFALLAWAALRSGSPAPAPPPAPASASSPRAVDLMPLIQTPRDAAGGSWRLASHTLTCVSDSGFARLSIPVTVPPRCTWRIRVRRDAPQGLLLLGFPVRGSRACLVLDWWDNRRGGPVSGFEVVDGRSLSEGRGRPTGAPLLAPGAQSDVELALSSDRLAARVNGQLVESLEPRQATLSIKSFWNTPDPTALLLGTPGGGGSAFTFTRLELEPD